MYFKNEYFCQKACIRYFIRKSKPIFMQMPTQSCRFKILKHKNICNFLDALLVLKRHTNMDVWHFYLKYWLIGFKKIALDTNFQIFVNPSHKTNAFSKKVTLGSITKTFFETKVQSWKNIQTMIAKEFYKKKWRKYFFLLKYLYVFFTHAYK